jgi:hypothetical protein
VRAVDHGGREVVALREVAQRLEREVPRGLARAVRRDHLMKARVRAHRALGHAGAAAREDQRVEVGLLARRARRRALLAGGLLEEGLDGHDRLVAEGRDLARGAVDVDQESRSMRMDPQPIGAGRVHERRIERAAREDRAEAIVRVVRCQRDHHVAALHRGELCGEPLGALTEDRADQDALRPRGLEPARQARSERSRERPERAVRVRRHERALAWHEAPAEEGPVGEPRERACIRGAQRLGEERVCLDREVAQAQRERRVSVERELHTHEARDPVHLERDRHRAVGLLREGLDRALDGGRVVRRPLADRRERVGDEAHARARRHRIDDEAHALEGERGREIDRSPR